MGLLLAQNSHQQELETLIETLRGEWLSEEESFFLTELLHKGELERVDRYIELQITLRTLEDKEALAITLELEKELENYCKTSKLHLFEEKLTLREQEQLLAAFLTSLGSISPRLAKELCAAHFSKQMEEMILRVIKEEQHKLPFADRLFLEDLLEPPSKSLEDWQPLLASFKELLFWEGVIDELIASCENRSWSAATNHDDLVIQLRLFEKELSSLHQLLAKKVIAEILPPFSDLGKSYLMGKVKKRFEELNDTYQALKTWLLRTPCDLHLCCMCHFSPEVQEFWPRETDPLHLRSLQNLGAKATHSKASLLIFTCGGGKGHLSVATALSEYAMGAYHVRIANTLEETLASIDVFKRMLIDFSQERLYNHLLKNEGFEWLKLIIRVGPFYLMMQQESIEKQLRLEVLKQRPDLLISCFPSMNAMFLNVAKEFNLPLLIVTTDLDTDFFTKGMHHRSCDLTYPKWKMTLAYDTPELRAIIEKRIPAKRVHVSGFPLRPAFREAYTPEERRALRQELGIAKESRVLLVVMGGVAGAVTEKYAALLAELSDLEVAAVQAKHLHVVCLCGDQTIAANREMRYHINALKPKSSQVLIQAVGPVANMALLMEIADGLITKPGGPITNEALAKGLPMIFHAPFALMDWEVFNMEFCIKAKMGSRFKLQTGGLFSFQEQVAANKDRLVPLIKEAFSRRNPHPRYLFETKDFGSEFLSLLDDLLKR